MKLALDHHYSPLIAEKLRERGHDVIAAIEEGWHVEPDEDLLALGAAEGRSLVTNNVRDFALVLRRWATEGRVHAGVIFTSDASLPRHRGTVGRYVELLDALLRAHPGSDDLADRVHWL